MSNNYGKNKLTKEQVLEIRKFLSLGVSQSHLARKYGVTPMSICLINKGISYKDIVLTKPVQVI